MTKGNCTTCNYYTYDEDAEEYFCDMDMDEDDAVRLYTQPDQGCPYYCSDNEYLIVRHQM